MKRMRMGGPTGAKRPYVCLPMTDNSHEQMAQALDHIATAISSIDHNLEAMANAVIALANRPK